MNCWKIKLKYNKPLTLTDISVFSFLWGIYSANSMSIHCSLELGYLVCKNVELFIHHISREEHFSFRFGKKNYHTNIAEKQIWIHNILINNIYCFQTTFHVKLSENAVFLVKIIKLQCTGIKNQILTQKCTFY